jgi:hypothetical protein
MELSPQDVTTPHSTPVGGVSNNNELHLEKPGARTLTDNKRE